MVDQEFVTDRRISKRIVEMIKQAEKEILIASPRIWESQEVIKSLEDVVEKNESVLEYLLDQPKEKRMSYIRNKYVFFINWGSRLS